MLTLSSVLSPSRPCPPNPLYLSTQRLDHGWPVLTTTFIIANTRSVFMHHYHLLKLHSKRVDIFPSLTPLRYDCNSCYDGWPHVLPILTPHHTLTVSEMVKALKSCIRTHNSPLYQCLNLVHLHSHFSSLRGPGVGDPPQNPIIITLWCTPR